MSAARAVALVVLLVGACRDASTPFQPEPHGGADRVVPGQYIVVFRDTVADPVGFAQSRVGPAQAGANAQGGTLLHTYGRGRPGSGDPERLRVGVRGRDAAERVSPEAGHPGGTAGSDPRSRRGGEADATDRLRASSTPLYRCASARGAPAPIRPSRLPPRTYSAQTRAERHPDPGRAAPPRTAGST